MAGGAARRVNAPVVLAAPAGEPERIGVAQVLLGEEGKLRPAVHAGEVVLADGAEAPPVGRLAEDARQGGSHTVELQRLQLFAIEGFALGPPHHGAEPAGHSLRSPRRGQFARRRARAMARRISPACATSSSRMSSARLMTSAVRGSRSE